MGVNFFRRDDRDPQFVLFETLDLNRLLRYEAFIDFTLDDFRMILDEGLKVAREKLKAAAPRSAQKIFYRGRLKPSAFSAARP